LDRIDLATLLVLIFENYPLVVLFALEN